MKLSTISRLTGAVRIRRVTNHSSESPYSWDRPLPPWVWMAWSSALQRGLGSGEFRDVGGLAGRFAGVEEFGAADGGQPAQFHRDVGFGQRVGDALVRADRRRPDLALLGVVGGLADRVPSDPAADRADQDPLGVQAGEYLPQTVAGDADQRVLADLDVVEEHGELIVRGHDRRVDLLEGQARAVGGNDE